MRAPKRSTIEEKRERARKKTKRKTHINIYLQLLFSEFWENILGTSQKSSNMWSKGRNAEVSPSVCYETGKLLIPAKSVKSRHTSSGCLNFSQKKIKRRKKKRRPWPRKYFLLHLLLGLQGNISRGPIKSEPQSRQWVVASRRSKSSK